MKSEEGIICETEGKYAKVRASRHSECENCGACPGSGASVITVRNNLNARVGQRVLFEVKDEKILRGAFLIFVLPLLALFIGVWLGGLVFTALSANALIGKIVGGVVLFALSAVIIRAYDRKHGGSSGAMPSIIKIIG